MNNGLMGFPGLQLPAIVQGALPEFKVRAWVRFSFTSPPTIYGSGNISSATYSGTGQVMLKLIVPMPDNNYAVVHQAQNTVSQTNTTNYVTTSVSDATQFQCTHVENGAGLDSNQPGMAMLVR